MVDSILQSFFDYSVEFAQKRFAEKGEISPMFVGMTADNEFVIMPVLEMTDGKQKDRLIATVKAEFKQRNVVACMFLTEAWMVAASTPELSKRLDKFAEHRSLQHHPDRIEVINIVCETKTETIQGHMQILRPEHGKPKLGKVWSTTVNLSGRLYGLLR